MKRFLYPSEYSTHQMPSPDYVKQFKLLLISLKHLNAHPVTLTMFNFELNSDK